MLFQSINALVKHLQKEQHHCRILELLPPGFKQKGQTCKLNALSAGLHFRYQNAPASSLLPPYPVKFTLRQQHGIENQQPSGSLRQSAKQLGSAVGELYDVRDLIELARIHGFPGVYARHYDSKESYSQALVTAIENQQAVNVFYDADPKTGAVVCTNSQSEHGAMVVGYALKSDAPVQIILSIWNQYIAVSIDALYQSTSQLQQSRKPEVFVKFPGKFWQNAQQDAMEINQAQYRKAKAPSDDAVSFRAAILYISEPAQMKKAKSLYENHGIEQLAEVNEQATQLTDFPSEAVQFTSDTGLPACDATPGYYSQQRAALNKPKYIPLDVLVHFLEVADSFQDKLSTENLQQFARYFEINDPIRKLCLIDNQTELSGALVDDIYRQNPDSRRSIVELISNAMDAKASRIMVNVADGNYRISDNGLGMTADILFNKLFVLKNSSKSVIADSIGRFGIGFYTSLAHLKEPEARVVLRTHSPQEREGYLVNFRYRNARIEVSIESREDIPFGTDICVTASHIHAEDYVKYARQYFASYQGDGLLINGEAITLADNYATWNTATASALTARADGKAPSMQLTIANVLINEIILPEKSNALRVIWRLPKDTSITESRDAVQVDSKALIHTVKALIDVVNDLPENEQLAYLNTISVAVLALQNKNALHGTENNLQLYLMRVLTTIAVNVQMVPDSRQFDFLATQKCVRIHPGIIPENWQDNLGFQPKEWRSRQVTALVVNEMAQDKPVHFDDISKTLYISDALYQKAKKNPSQLTALTNVLLRDNVCVWKFSKSKSTFYRTAELYNFSDYSQPRHHALYLQHGGLAYVEPAVLDAIDPNDREVLRAAVTLVAKYPFKGRLEQRTQFRSSQNCFIDQFSDSFLSPFEYQGEHYFVSSAKRYTWKTRIICDEHFHPVAGKRIELLRALVRDSLEVIPPKALTVDKVIMKKGKSAQLLSIETEAVVLDNLPLYSYYQAIPDSPYYIIRSRGESCGVEEVMDSYLTNRIYDNENKCVAQFQAVSINVIPWQGFYLVFFYIDRRTKINLHDKNFNKLSSVSIGHCYGSVQIDNISTVRWNGDTLMVIARHPTAAVLKLHDDRIEVLESARLVGKKLSEMIIDDQLYQIADGHLHYLGRVKRFKHCDIPNFIIVYREQQYLHAINSTFVIYETKDSQHTLLTPNNQHWVLAADIDYQAITNCDANRAFLAIQQGERHLEPHLVMRRGASEAPLVCDTFTFAESALDVFVLVDGERLINSQGVEVFHSPEAMKVESDPACPYLILICKVSGGDKTEYCIINSDGSLLFSSRLKFARFLAKQDSWRIVARGDDKAFSITAAGIVYHQKGAANASWCFDTNFPYLFYPEQRRRFQPDEIKKITANTYVVRGRGNASDPTVPTCFYRQLPDKLLGDKAVLANLHYLNQRNISLDEYSNALRFVDCLPEQFVALYPFLPLLTYTPTREQFSVYYAFYQQIFATNRAFLKKAIRLIDLIYFAAGKHADIDLGAKIIDIAKLYGISVLSQLYGVYSKKQLQLYRVLNVDNNLDTFLAPMPQKLRELSYYLFSRQSSLFNEKMPALLVDNNHFAHYYSLLDLITVASLRTRDLAQFQSPEELFLLLATFDKKIDIGIARRKLLHAIYHLSDASTPNYLREMIQNAMDASAKGKSIRINLYQDDSRHVTRVDDEGCGMDLFTIAHYLANPGNSTKRGHAEFIGGRGVGFASAFHGAESISLKTGKGQGVVYYFHFIPVYDEQTGRIIDVKCSGCTEQAYFTGTSIERVSRSDNGALEAARTLSAARQFGRFVDANRYKILLNDSQINESLEYIGEINIAALGMCRIYSNAESAFTSGGLFIKYIDEVYWGGIPAFIARQLKALGIIIELPGSIVLTRERNNFYAADKFREFFQPVFFQLCLNAYCNLLRNGKIEANCLPDDLFRDLRRYQNTTEKAIIADADKINNGQLFEDYARYFSPDNCVLLLTHIAFIHYGNALVSLADIARLNQSSTLAVEQLPHFVAWRLKEEKRAIRSAVEYEKILSTPGNRYEQELMKYKHCNWSLDDEDIFKNAPNWELFFRLCTQILATVADKYNLEFTILFSTELSYAKAFVVPAEFDRIIKQGKQIKQTSIYLNPFNWQSALNLLFTANVCKDKTNNFLDVLIETLSHEIAHIEEESFCASGQMTFTHNASFRDLHATIFADLMLLTDTEALIEQTTKEIESFYENAGNNPELPSAKELMIMQLFDVPDYLEYLKSEEIQDQPEP